MNRRHVGLYAEAGTHLPPLAPPSPRGSAGGLGAIPAPFSAHRQALGLKSPMATEVLPPVLLEAPLVGRNLPGASLQDCLDPNRPTLVAFLRHFG